MKRFVAVMNIPSPYRLHLLGELARQLKELGVDFHCHFMARGHKDRPKSWLNPKIDFPHAYWPDYGVGEYHFNPGLIYALWRNPPDWMVCGSSFDSFTGIAVTAFGRAKVKMAWLEGNTKTTGEMNGFRGWFKRFVISNCQYAPVPGSDAANYIGLHQALTKRTMPKPVYLPNLVDETRFCPRAEWPHEEIRNVRRKLNVSESQKVCLIPARLEEVKGLVPFFSLLTAEMLKGWKIVLMGQGALKATILRTINERGLSPFVDLLDYVPYAEMPRCYAAADLMLLPSVYDPNPLTVVEALHSGLPAALSCMAGNVEEAVTEGKNGWVLHVQDRARFECELKKVFSASLDQLRTMGVVSKSVNSKFWDTKGSIANFIAEVVK